MLSSELHPEFVMLKSKLQSRTSSLAPTSGWHDLLINLDRNKNAVMNVCKCVLIERYVEQQLHVLMRVNLSSHFNTLIKRFRLIARVYNRISASNFQSGKRSARNKSGKFQSLGSTLLRLFTARSTKNKFNLNRIQIY